MRHTFVVVSVKWLKSVYIYTEDIAKQIRFRGTAFLDQLYTSFVLPPHGEITYSRKKILQHNKSGVAGKRRHRDRKVDTAIYWLN